MAHITIGVDIGKDTLDVHALPCGSTCRFSNDKAGHKSLMGWLSALPGRPERIVFEPTGPYHRALEQHLAEAGLPLVKVNPRRARRFAEAVGTLAKTDPIDAGLLARMGAALELEPVAAQPKGHAELKELQQARQGLLKDRTAALNRQKMVCLPMLQRQITRRLKTIESDLKAIDAQIAQYIAADERRADQARILVSIPGIAQITAAGLLTEIPELGTLDSKAVANLAGLAPKTRQSGRWTGRAFIEGGRSLARRILYMAALSAIQFNPDMKAKYRQLVEAGKPKKLALTAVMRKLIVLANALIKDNREWEQRQA